MSVASKGNGLGLAKRETSKVFDKAKAETKKLENAEATLKKAKAKKKALEATKEQAAAKATMPKTQSWLSEIETAINPFS